jgi:2,3,4,5-tetrahydropyridine-2-carboxylate N-succinyltransferase
MDTSQLQSLIEQHVASGAGAVGNPQALDAFIQFRTALERGEIRSASPDPASPTGWKVNVWVKQGILLGFRIGVLEDFPSGSLSFVDKSTYPARHMTAADGVRVVVGGSSIRTGAFVARGVVCAPPMYINTGAWVDEGTMVDSHALVGSCAQIGKRVHLSAAAQIGGVLEPVNASPVIIEDDVLVGGNCGVYEGTIVRRGAVLAAGAILTRGTPVFDLVNGTVIRSSDESPLIIPENAVVVPGSRAVAKGKGHPDSQAWGLSLYAAVIVKYRDDKTCLSTTLEDLLR